MFGDFIVFLLKYICILAASSIFIVVGINQIISNYFDCRNDFLKNKLDTEFSAIGQILKAIGQSLSEKTRAKEEEHEDK